MATRQTNEGYMRTIQALPGEGWYARFRTPDGIVLQPVLCWVLREHTASKNVYLGAFILQADGLPSVGTVEDLIDLEIFDNFAGYVDLRDNKAPAGSRVISGPQVE